MRKAFSIGVFTLALAAGALAQSVAGLGAVSGAVRDASGASVAGAQVVLSNDAKGIRRTMQTTDAGVFSAPALVPAGGYSLSVAKPGFDNWEIKDFPITVGQTVDFKVTLQVGATTTRVDITGEVPLVEDTKSGVTATVGHDQI